MEFLEGLKQLNLFRGAAKQLVIPVGSEDLAAVEKAKRVNQTGVQNTGMSPEEFSSIFGSFPPNKIAELCALAGKPVPRNPQAWRAYATEVAKIQAALMGLKVINGKKD